MIPEAKNAEYRVKKKSCLRGRIFFFFFFTSRFPREGRKGNASETSVKFIVSEACKRYFKVNSEPTIHRVSVYVLNCFIRLLSVRFSSRNESRACLCIFLSPLIPRPSVFLYTLVECDLQTRAHLKKKKILNVREIFYNLQS